MDRLWLAAILLPSSLGLAQVTGPFALEKSAYAPAEPVFLSFTMHNAGKQTEEVSSADPYSFCSGYQIHITRDSDPEPACFQSWGGSCLSGALSLAPGASHTERLLLNYRNASRGDPESAIHLPGDYTIDATRSISLYPFSPDPPASTVHETFHMRVESALALSAATYTPYVQQLSSADSNVRREAARTLATFAPPALEPLLLSFSTSKDEGIKQFAPLALSNLASSASVAALAEMLVHTSPGTNEYITAAQDLGKTHDPAWFPLLLEVANQHGDMYLSYAAESGGDAALPALVSRLHSPDGEARLEAVQALGQTGSRAAVPVLISVLPAGGAADTELGRTLAIAANGALAQLTHLSPKRDPDDASIPGWHARWQNW